MSSTLAAFIVAFVANLPAFLSKELRGTPSTIGVFSYLYLGWLLWYFFISSFNMEQAAKYLRPARKKQVRDISFQVIQSAASLTAAFFLGFLDPNPKQEHPYGFRAAQSAISLICFLSWLLFRRSSVQGKNLLRVCGGVASAVPLLLLLLLTSSVSTVRCVSRASLILLWLILLVYTRISYDERDREPAV